MRIIIMFFYVNVLISICSVLSSSLSFLENVSFDNKIINKNRLQKVYGCQTSLDICSKLCDEVALCASFFHNDNCSICQLHSVRFENSAEGVSENGWRYFLKPRDCEDVFKMGFTIDGVYEIYRDGTYYNVYCDMNRKGWTVFQRRMDGSTNFYRNWTSYVSGFGNISHEFWLGLEKIYELTSSANYKLRFDMEDHDGVWKYATYSNFRLGDASAEYNLKFDTYSGTAGDALAFNKGNNFSTYDNDINSCSALYGGGWWYSHCHNANLNGFYGNVLYGKGLVWKQWHGHYYSLKTTEMKIRRI